VFLKNGKVPTGTNLIGTFSFLLSALRHTPALSGFVQRFLDGCLPVDLSAHRAQDGPVAAEILPRELCVAQFTGNHACLRVDFCSFDRWSLYQKSFDL
jgi:hypothetical protein